MSNTIKNEARWRGGLEAGQKALSPDTVINYNDVVKRLEAYAETNRSEASARAFLQSMTDYELEANIDAIRDALNLEKAFIRKLHKAETKSHGTGLDFDEPQPASEPQDGAKLLQDIQLQIRRFIIADTDSILAAALWIVLAHLTDSVAVLPLLVLNSPVKACGKSSFLDVIARLVPKAIPVANISTAALFRSIDQYKPTLLIDEADHLFQDNNDLRTLLNAGFSRNNAFALRTVAVGDNFESRMFSTWGAKALALIGRLPDTLESRSVIVPMRRKLPSEHTERLRSDIDQGFVPLKARIIRWARDNAGKIAATDPVIPDGLTDRQADIWRELLRIADVVDADIGYEARIAARSICDIANATDSGDFATLLLQDLKTMFESEPSRTAWPSYMIIQYLTAIEGRPWAEYRHGKPLSENGLARLLARFDIRPLKLDSNSRGYKLSQFNDVLSRYLPNSTAIPPLSDDKSLLNNELQNSGCYGGSTSQPPQVEVAQIPEAVSPDWPAQAVSPEIEKVLDETRGLDIW
ncbi:MAG: hypothetical protein BWX81_00507 [Spirochaetes bacterium ADurb.Bin110]|nr:MAG: hypothetical protein BWX81_00507 [Spirochaetes bacterium ADurb.Bin110]